MTVIGDRTNKNSEINNKARSSSVSEKVKAIEEGGISLSLAAEATTDDGDDESIATTDLRKLINAEVTPPKSLVLIWILMAVELGFDLITTGIAFWSTLGSEPCCGYTVYMGPLPMTTSIPFFFLIIAEITFLIRAILLTLWPSVFEASRVAAHGRDDTDNSNDNDEKDQVGFEVTLAIIKGKTTKDGDDEDDSVVDGDGKKLDGTTTTKEDDVTRKDDDDDKAENEQKQSPESATTTTTADANITIAAEDLYNKDEEDPEFVDEEMSSNSKQRNKNSSSCFRRACCCFLRWNARMVLTVLNLLTLANPFFGCLIAFILLYQSDKTECFVVLGIESLSIVLHFVSVRMEGGLRTWWSKLLHSVAILPFLVTVVLVLVYIREGGMCYSVESELFLFSGCEVCPETQAPPVHGMCGNYTLAGMGGFKEDFKNIGDSFHSFGDLKNIASLAARGAEQAEYCSDNVNFCFYEF